MKICIIGAGHLAGGTAIHEACEMLLAQGHEIIEVESGEEIRGMDIDMMVIDDEIVEYKIIRNEAPHLTTPLYQNNKPPGRRRGQRKGNYHWSK
jgi:hypothetical protein